MGSHKLRSKDLRKLGYASNEAISLAMQLATRHLKYSTKTQKLEVLRQVIEDPDSFTEDEAFGQLAELFIEASDFDTAPRQEHTLREKPAPFHIWGRRHIQTNALQQMEMAMRLPVAESGALMPDAHQGYGLPIGGVLATENAIIPYAVGLDIGCRMSLTVLDAKPEFLNRYRHQAKEAIKEHTYFGMKGLNQTPREHEVLDRPEFGETELLRKLHQKAARQLGTSGSGNHFVEFGTLEVGLENQLDLPEGKYLALLTHSGSRGLGATVAGYYTQIARERCLLPREAQSLAWLDLDTAEGQEYWRAMNLAGDYAKACHDEIHRILSRELGLKAITNVENHHNFAWKEKQPDGRELVVHRKGSTPAGKGVMGIIPGSMTAPGYVVSGLGQPDALQSASHGAGRKMSRRKARLSVTGSDMKKMLKHTGVTLIGGGTDEAPVAYKDLDDVMDSQRDLVKIEGKFFPKLVRMDKP